MVACLSLCACESISYYSQAAQGQWHILRGRTPIEEVINSGTAPKAIKAKLELTQRVRQFAKDRLALSRAGGYIDYVDIGRPYVVWNVFAAPEFDVNPMTWCFPIAGCVPYRGYFSEQDANAYAKTLAAQGYDVHVGGVEAYSTLGWFRDPVLSTFLARDDANLAALLIHEMSHQHLYLPGDATFNESYATTVEIEGLGLWLHQNPSSAGAETHAESLALRDAFIELLMQHREKLRVLFASNQSIEEKRIQKTALNEELLRDYKQFKRTHPNAGNRFDGWFNRPINNARLSSLATYSRWVPAMRAVFTTCSGNFACFHERIEELSELPADKRQATLEQWETFEPHPK